jgi:tryptophan-rich sensory protein
MKISYVFPAIAVVITALVGGLITSGGMTWYQSLSLPSFTPPGYIISIVWSIIFVLSAYAMILVLQLGKKEVIAVASVVFGLNLLLNMLWSTLFFGIHEIGFAFFEAILLAFSVLVLMTVSWKTSKTIAWLLAPYFVWTSFASFLTYSVWMLN